MDMDVHVLPGSGGAGLRAVAGTCAFGSEDVKVAGTFIPGWPVSGPYLTMQTMSWFALGPSWSIPRAENRTELFVMVGAASTEGSGVGPLVSMSGSQPGSTKTWIGIGGAVWVHRLARSRFALEVGGELQAGGRGVFWDSPPIVPNGAGSYLFRTRKASIGGAALRCGLNFQRRHRSSGHSKLQLARLR
jgi:hypothetical protein